MSTRDKLEIALAGHVVNWPLHVNDKARIESVCPEGHECGRRADKILKNPGCSECNKAAKKAVTIAGWRKRFEESCGTLTLDIPTDCKLETLVAAKCTVCNATETKQMTRWLKMPRCAACVTSVVETHRNDDLKKRWVSIYGKRGLPSEFGSAITVDSSVSGTCDYCGKELSGFLHHLLTGCTGCKVSGRYAADADADDKALARIHPSLTFLELPPPQANRRYISINYRCSEGHEGHRKINNLLCGRGCGECEAVALLDKPNFLKRAKNLYGDKYDYRLLEDVVRGVYPIRYICEKHGVVTQIASDHVRTHGCAHCERDEEDGYVYMWTRGGICKVGHTSDIPKRFDNVKLEDVVIRKMYKTTDNAMAATIEWHMIQAIGHLPIPPGIKDGKTEAFAYDCTGGKLDEFFEAVLTYALAEIKHGTVAYKGDLAEVSVDKQHARLDGVRKRVNSILVVTCNIYGSRRCEVELPDLIANLKRSGCVLATQRMPDIFNGLIGYICPTHGYLEGRLCAVAEDGFSCPCCKDDSPHYAYASSDTKGNYFAGSAAQTVVGSEYVKLTQRNHTLSSKLLIGGGFHVLFRRRASEYLERLRILYGYGVVTRAFARSSEDVKSEVFDTLLAYVNGETDITKSCATGELEVSRSRRIARGNDVAHRLAKVLTIV